MTRPMLRPPLRPGARADSAVDARVRWQAPTTSTALAPSRTYGASSRLRSTTPSAWTIASKRSRTLAYLAQTALKSLEVGEVQDRLAVLEESVLGRRVLPSLLFEDDDGDVDIE